MSLRFHLKQTSLIGANFAVESLTSQNRKSLLPLVNTVQSSQYNSEKQHSNFCSVPVLLGVRSNGTSLVFKELDMILFLLICTVNIGTVFITADKMCLMASITCVSRPISPISNFFIQVESECSRTALNCYINCFTASCIWNVPVLLSFGLVATSFAQHVAQ